MYFIIGMIIGFVLITLLNVYVLKKEIDEEKKRKQKLEEEKMIRQYYKNKIEQELKIKNTKQAKQTLKEYEDYLKNNQTPI